MTQVFKVLIPITNPVVGPTAGCATKYDHDFVSTRRISDREMHGQIMRASPRIVLVH